MSTQVQWRRGTTTELAAFLGVEGEFNYDRTLRQVICHDGVTRGGFYVGDPAILVLKSYATVAASLVNNSDTTLMAIQKLQAQLIALFAGTNLRLKPGVGFQIRNQGSDNLWRTLVFDDGVTVTEPGES